MKRICLLAIICALLLFTTGGAADEPEKAGGKKIYRIAVKGDVEPGMAAFLKRGLSITDDPDAIFIIEMDTFGGRVDSALMIVDTILNTPKGKTIAFVSKKAISAGALIALSCNELAMKHHTTIGDCAPILMSQEGPKMMGEKFQSPLRAKFRSLAKKNGYPENLAEAMVTLEKIVYAIEIDGKTVYMDSQEYEDLPKEEKDKITKKKTVVAKGELLTMDDVEAKELGFSKMSVKDVDELLEKMGLQGREVIPIEESWSESFVRLINKIAPILMMIGLAAIYTELRSPGFGIPGAIGIICLSLVFFSQYLVGLADHTELLLILAGIVLLCVEVFVLPGFGINGFAGMVCLALGMVLAFQDFVIPDPAFPWEKDILINNLLTVFLSYIFAFFFSLGLIRYALPGLSKFVKGPYLSATLEESHAGSPETQAVKVGDRGVALSFLRPSGKIKIETEIYDAITEGEFIEKDSRVVVADIKGNRIIVAKESMS